MSRVWKKNNALQRQGFTLLETLLSLAIFSGVIILVSLLISYYVKVLDLTYDQRVVEWEMFHFYVVQEARKSIRTQYTDKQLSFTMENGDIIQYDRYQNMVRRRVNGRGFEPVLLQVDAFAVTGESASMEIFLGFETSPSRTVVVGSK